MVEVAVLDFSDPKNRNRWAVGTPNDVPKSSPFYSEQIQIAYVSNPEREWFFKMQKEHIHIPPIEEYYLVLQGTLKVKVEDAVFALKPMQLLAVPPNKCHTIIDYSSPLQYFLIRNSVSGKKTKIECGK
jgi:mannose-6-phosphate isomerase-like protein (cupin superfamily)